ncbi:hypothetical protein [Streptomyces sp. NPDC051219]|uniref:hypothetical protein n=1 Tax=Streptomyces sp. NPDC051219 TaxID=3155283 RepID=UPI00343314A6
MSWPDVARRERTAERAHETAPKRAEDLARYLREHDHLPEDTGRSPRSGEAWPGNLGGQR